ncbi:MAG: aminopeptidase [Bacteroidales bacterium]|nr:aminopeptidase [Bacteroidales bacterium]
MKKYIAIASAVLVCAAASAQGGKPERPNPDAYQFTTVKEIPITPVKNQFRSGTCWCFSSLSFLESEVIKAKNIKDESAYPDFSEMWVVRNAYHDRALKYVRLDGKLNFAAGSDFGDVLCIVRDYGLVPQDKYSGMNYGTDLPVQGELDAVLKGYVEAVVKNSNRSLTPVWSKGFDGILDAYLGPVPDFDAAAYRDSMGIDPDDFVGFTSYTHHPFYTQFAIEVEDNWRWTPSWNLPLEEFMAVIDNALENGYTVLWGGDVSEIGFTRDGLGVLVDKEAKVTAGSDQEKWVGKAEEKPAEASGPKIAPEAEVTQESRQKSFDNKQSTDDHGMHIFGIAKDQNGTKYYLVKNSWGESGKYKGIWYMSENYAKEKTLNFVVNRKAVPKDIKKKLNIK